MPGPLEGVRVLDFSRLAPGAYCTMLLADMGADVVRVDRAGEPERPLFGDVVGRGKRSVALDLKQAAGVEAALRLLSQADVLVEGFRPGVMERLGLGPDRALIANPRLVYARLTGWGQTGPLAPKAGHDINYIAISGVLSAIGRAGSPPVPPVNLLGDLAGGGLFCALGVVSALFERERSGLGQVIDAAMLDGSASLFTPFAAAVQKGSWRERGTNIIDSGAHYYEVYETADGGYLSVGAIEGPFYDELLAGLGLSDDPTLRHEHDRGRWPELKERLATVFRTKTSGEWCEIFAGRDACVYPVLPFREAPRHPHNAARGVFADAFGVLQPAPAPRFGRTPGSIAGPPPTAGQHTHEVLREAGFAEEEISILTKTTPGSE